MANLKKKITMETNKIGGTKQHKRKEICFYGKQKDKKRGRANMLQPSVFTLKTTVKTVKLSVQKSTPY